MDLRSTWWVLCVVAMSVAIGGCGEADDDVAGCYAPPGQCSCDDGSVGTRSCVPGQDYVVCVCGGPMLGIAGGGAPPPNGVQGSQNQNQQGMGDNTMMGEPMSGEPVQDEGMAMSPVEEDPAQDPIISDDPTVPDGAHCQPTAGWDAGWADFEYEVLVLINEERAVGGDCGGQAFGPSGPLTSNANLRCSARLHSKDMSDRSFFAHDTPDGVDPFARMQAAGYSGGTMGENIAMGQTTPREVVDGWMNSPGHCSNILNSGFDEIGIGYYKGPDSGWTPGNYWTQNFGGAGGGWF